MFTALPCAVHETYQLAEGKIILLAHAFEKQQ
jgi:hypothetical protein